jgi:DNA-binding phage protein
METEAIMTHLTTLLAVLKTLGLRLTVESEPHATAWM